MTWQYVLYQWSRTALDWLFPPTCAGCGAPRVRWCSDCHQKVRRVEPPYCQCCGQELQAGEDSVCDRCQKNPPGMTAIRSWAIFGGPLRQALHRIKYKRDIALAVVFANSMMNCLERQGWAIDLVTPVPIGKKRKKQRGYNQAGLLAKPLALGLGLSYKPRALRKVRDTVSQVGLTLQKRRQNVDGAFRSSSSLVESKTVLVVDDVVTSGSTLEACASALWQVGADNVYGLTLARAPLSSN